ncbi:hypothetical protein L7F22_004830 [Adiantum nelumboides]|nr:hypothetical protein [Adiantum nelumboides]
MAIAATRLGHGMLARLSSSLPGRLVRSPLHRTSGVAFLSRRPQAFPRFFASSFSGHPEPSALSSSLSSSSSSSSSASSASSSFAPTWGGIGTAILDPMDRPRMPAVPEERPKPTTAVTVVEAYLDKLWRDFFTNPHNWFDNRLRRRAPKYADFKNKLTKEGLWITAKWNPPWVRTELSLMTHFRAVPYDDPLWAKKAAEEEEEK